MLGELGFSEAESTVYLALLEAGPCTAGVVIKKTGLHRATTYQILQRLIEKGLASSIVEGKQRHFSAASPRRLLDVLRERQRRLSEALPSLEALQSEGGQGQEVTVYSGVNGIRSALNRMLEEIGRNGEYYDFGVSGLFREVMGSYFQLWQREKRERRITSYVIFNEKLRTNLAFFEEYYGKARFHPREYASLTDTMIYKDTVILLIWTAKPPLAVMVKNAENARSYRNQFLLMWKQAGRG